MTPSWECSACGEDFASLRYFDAHQRGRRAYDWSPEQPDGRRCRLRRNCYWRRAGDETASGVGAIPGMRRGPLAYFGAHRVEDEEGNGSWTRGRRLATIAPPDVKAYVQSLRAAGLKTQTIRNYLTPVKAMFADAFEDGLIRVDPAARVRVTAQQATR